MQIDWQTQMDFPVCFISMKESMSLAASSAPLGPLDQVNYVIGLATIMASEGRSELGGCTYTEVEPPDDG